MPGFRNIILHDRFGCSLRGRLLAGGHIVLSEHAHRYTYARVNGTGEIELYDDAGNFSRASLFADEGGDIDPDDPESWGSGAATDSPAMHLMPVAA